MTAYYNENDPFAAAWLRNLVSAGHIAAGDVDERSIVDVHPEDLHDYAQCHFFAGIGGWSLALRLAGWPDDRPVWTGSCPCQPFSAAGRGAGFADERHLWPAFYHLISECRPGVVLGEQVASKDGLGWLDAVHTDMEDAGYAFGAVDLCAAGCGAPHIRQRLYFAAERLADAGGGRAARFIFEERGVGGEGSDQARAEQRHSGGGADGGVADADGQRQPGQHALLQPGRPHEAGTEAAGNGAVDRLADRVDQGRQGRLSGRTHPRREDIDGHAGRGGATDRLADADSQRRQQVGRGASGDEAADGRARRDGSQPDGDHLASGHGEGDRPCTVDGFWRNADRLLCRDGRWRPVESGTFPLADGIPGRVGQLRAYGNAIVPQVAAEFIRAALP